MSQSVRSSGWPSATGIAVLAALVSSGLVVAAAADRVTGAGFWAALAGNFIVVLGAPLLVRRFVDRRPRPAPARPARGDVAEAPPPESGLSALLARLNNPVPDLSGDSSVEVLMRALLATSPAGLALSTRDGRARYVSERWARLMGYTLGDLPDGHMIHIYDDPADRKAYVEILNRDGRVSDHELRLRRKDGSVMWVILNGTIVPFGAEELIVAWTYDVTERHRRAERMRLAAEQEQKTILDTSPVGIGFFTDQRMVHCNQMLVSLFGYPDLAALQARPLPTLLADPDDLPRLAKEAVQHFDAGGRYQGEWLTVRADGTPFWAQLTAMRLPDTGGDRTALWMVEDITERRQREQTLADREALLRVLLESSPAGLALATPGGELRYATPLWSEMFGYDVESFKGLTAAVLYSDPADRVGFTELLQRDGRVVDREKMAKRRDGSTFWARVSATPVRIGGEDLIAVWVQDSTQRRLYDEQLAAAQEALRVAVEEHRAIFETSAQGVGLLKDRVILRCNRRMEEIFGYEPGALVGRGTRILYDSDEAYELAGRGYNQAIRGETNVREQRMMRSDGSLFWCRITGRAMVPGDPGRGFVISYEDVNDQHAAIVAIRAMNEEQLAIFAAVTSGIALIKDRSIRSCNAKLEEIFGYAAGEFRGKPTRLWYATDEAHAAIGREIRDDFSRGATHRSEREVVRKDGTPFWCRFSGRLLDPADPDKGAVWMVEDVTEEREAAAALLHAKELAEEATRAKSMFLANMSHEIRTPMNAIIGLSHLALQTELTARQRDYVKKVHDAGTSLLGIVNDILDFSKVEAGKLDVESTRFVLDQMLDRVSSLVAQRAYDKGLELLFDVAPDVPQALIGDPLRFGQVLTNLVSNAIKFTDRGQVEVVVRVGERDGRDVQLLVEVRDTGIGMSDEQSARLFQAFTQVDGSATRKYGGTGLGLTISKRLVDLMGGEIHVRSVQGRGSTFTFTLRLKIDEQGGAAQRVLPDALNGMRMLIVDDNAAARDILSEQLRALRFDVVAVESGETALRAVRDEDRARPFGALMLDWKMPGLDGIEVARLVRTGTHLRQVPRMILVTAFAAETVRTQAEAAGIEAFLSKPVSRSALVDTLVELFVPKDGVLVQSGTSSLASRVDLGGVRLLLVEDNEINRQIAVELLQRAGARVDTANNGQEALDRLLVAGPKAWQMVLMDVQMPVMDGLEATRRIRMDRRFDDVPIIAMTAHAMVEERRRCTEAGMVDHISKPIDPDSMMRTIAQRLGIAPVPYVAAPVAKSAGVEFPVIEGLDSIAGLQRVGGDSKLYRGLLLMFAERQTHAVEQVQASLVTGNTAAAEQLVHSVRGAAGNLGFVGLFDAASAFELAIRNGDDTVAVAGLFAQRLNDAITAIDTTLREPASEPADDAAPPEDMSARVGELATLLEDSDGQVLDFAAANPAVIRALFAGPAAVEFDKAIRNFDFDHALAMLKDAAETGGVPLDGA